MATDLLLLAAALVTGGVLWRSGSRVEPGLRGWRSLRGWRLFAVAILVGLATSVAVGLAGRVPRSGLFDPTDRLAPLPAVLLALLAVLTLGRGQLRAGGARLLTETALFFSASLVLAQVLVIGPALGASTLAEPARQVLELACLLTASVLSAVLVLISVSSGPRRVSGALLLVAAAIWATAHGLAVAAAELHLSLLADGITVAQFTSLALLCLAALRDPGADAVTPPTRTTTRLSLAGQLLPHSVMVVAAALYLGAPLVGADPTPVAGVALLCCLALTVVHRAVAARDEVRIGSRLRRSEAYFRSLVHSSTDAVLILDSRLRVTWAAPALQPPAGDPTPTGRLLTDVVHPDDAEQVGRWLAGGSDADGSVPGRRCSFRLKDGSGEWRVLEAGVSDLRADADVRALVLHCRDVTARLDREHEL
ncbi:MAG: Diguanylate cyclase, partial [Modestobacter sp.]|nr:Diguanylate cyclase [Modestobacter sp.]